VSAVGSTNPLLEFVRRSLELDSPAELERRADTLAGIGYSRVADHFREQARHLRAQQETARPATYQSPIPEATDEQWEHFARLMQTGELSAVTPSGQVGLFQTRLKRLEDLGLASNVHRENHHGGATWTATIRPPLTMERLLADPLAQYRIFAASMTRYRAEILSHHRRAIGTDIDGKRATLSGLLAVAHHAGPALASWLANSEDRRRFERTTAAYNATTGVF
jgi:hypothetical protein